MEQFIELVTSMRTAQKEYFRTRSPDALNRSKTLEKQVDNYLLSVDQPKLFWMSTCKNCYGTGEEPDTYDISKRNPVTPCHVCKGLQPNDTKKKKLL